MNDVRINYRVLSNKKVFKNLRFHMCRYLNLKSVKTSGLKVAHKLFQVTCYSPFYLNSCPRRSKDSIMVTQYFFSQLTEML